MDKTRLALLLAVFGLAFAQTPSFAGTAWAPATGSRYVQDQILVKFKPGVTAASRAQIGHNYGTLAMQSIGTQRDLVLTHLVPGQTVEQAIATLASDPNVEYAQPNYIYHALAYPRAIPTDPKYGQLWAANNTAQNITTGTYSPTTGTAGDDMNLERAWYYQSDCSSVVVAVVDTGVNYNATDLAANMWMGNANHGQNFATDGAAGDPMDLAGHGTHVAGIIAAKANNSIAGVGVCWSAQLMAVRVLDATGSGNTATISQGVNYAVTNGAKVINMSLGGTASDPTFSQAISDAQTAGVLVVVAAGNSAVDNDSTSNGHWPCNYTNPNLICVAALDQNYALATFSDWGATSVDVGAPGTNIYSTWAGSNATTVDPLNAGWFKNTTTAGGFVYGTASTSYGLLNSLNDPGSWPTGTYTANTTDQAWKNFNLNGVNSATLDIYGAIQVRSDGQGYIAQSSTGGNPFLPSSPAYLWGPAAADASQATSPTYAFLPTINLNNCLTTACTIGFELKTGSLLDLGVSIAFLQITTLTLNNASYNTIDGTSMATPEVAGVAALVWAHNPLYTYVDVVNAINNGGRSIAALSGKTTTGKAVDALGSLAYINPPTGIAVIVH